MSLALKSITNYAVPLWLMPSDEEDNDVPEFVEGDLVEADATDNTMSYLLVYSKRDSVNKVEGRHVLI